MGEIQNLAPNQPIISNPEAGQACVALYKDDGEWYRGEILAPIHENSNALIVLFTDFGNVELVSRKDIRYITTNWLKVPMQCLLCKIGGIRVNKDVENYEELADEFSDTLFKGTCEAKIHSIQPLIAEFCNENGFLIYQEFITKGLFSIK